MEVMFGKIVPYIIVGYVQMGGHSDCRPLSLSCPHDGQSGPAAFRVAAIYCCQSWHRADFSHLGPQPVAGRADGFFFFLPSILLSGFMFFFAACLPGSNMPAGMLPLPATAAPWIKAGALFIEQ
jgi:ABC-2 type transport system permease protein